MDLESRRRWEEYTKAKEVMLERTHIPEAPWWVVQADDKKKARLNCIAPPADPARRPPGWRRNPAGQKAQHLGRRVLRRAELAFFLHADEVADVREGGAVGAAQLDLHVGVDHAGASEQTLAPFGASASSSATQRVKWSMPALAAQ
jgi:hypothetical protein